MSKELVADMIMHQTRESFRETAILPVKVVAAVRAVIWSRWGRCQYQITGKANLKKPAASLLGVSQTDQRVILDALAIVAVSLKTNVKPANCNSWTAWEVAKAACSYYGSCGFKDGTYYCNTFCRNYSKFGGKGDCAGAVSKMQDNCWQ